MDQNALTDKQKLIAKIEKEGRADKRVVEVLAQIPREEFVPANLRPLAYRDAPLDIGEEQTISQPSLVAIMTSELHLKNSARVLEVGTGCGYQTAILAKLASEVCTVEVRSRLSEQAQTRLKKMGFANVHFKVGDGHLGWLEKGPFDAIIVTAAALEVPPALMEQLKVGGRMVIPVGREHQDLFLVKKTASGREMTEIFPVKFVPMVYPH